MNRRIICIYAISMITGILLASLGLEEGHLSGAFLLTAMILGLCSLFFRSYGEETGLDRRYGSGMLLCLAAGALIFTHTWLAYDVGEEVLARDRKPETVTGVVCSGSTREDHQQYVLLCDLPSGRKKVLCNDYRESAELPEPGDVLTVRGELRLPSERRNPGCFDYRRYLKSKGILYTLSVKNCGRKEPDSRPVYVVLRALGRKRQDFISLFDPGDTGGLIRGAVFGDRTGLSEDVYREFKGNGTAHILAVSGLHVGFLLSVLQRLTKGHRATAAILLMTLTLIGYGFLTAWNVPTVRAVMIALMALYSRPAGRRFDMTSAVAASAMIQLGIQPYQLFQAGFLLSYLAIAGLAFLSEPLSHFIGRTLAGLLSLQIAIIPYMIESFNHWNPCSLLINIPVVFLASVMIPAAVIGFAVFLIAGGLPLWVTGWISEMFEWEIRLNHLLYGQGDLDHLVLSPDAGVVIALLAAVFFLSSETVRILLLRRSFRTAAGVFLMLMLPVMVYGSFFRNEFRDDEIVFVVVGQGDCTHIRAGSLDVLIDGGGSTFYNVGEQVLLPYLLKNGAPDVDLACVTHLHTDHYLGICQLAEEYPVGAVGIPSEYRRSVRDLQKGAGTKDAKPGSGLLMLPDEIRFIEPGERITLTEDVYIKPIWPVAGRDREISADDPNENNMVYMIHYKGVRIMVTGDLLEADELEMLDYYAGTDTLKCDVLKVAHHGSKSSSCEAFLDAAAPSVAVIQAGENNLYGHPHRVTLEKLEDRGILICRTDQSGAVGLDIRRGGIVIDRVIPS